MKHLPLEIYEKIFTFATPEVIYLSSLVCKDWRNIITRSKVILLHGLSCLATSKLPDCSNRAAIKIDEVLGKFFLAAKSALLASWISTIPTAYHYGKQTAAFDAVAGKLLEGQAAKLVFKGASDKYGEPPLVILPKEDSIYQLLYSTKDEYHEDFKPLIYVEAPGRSISQGLDDEDGASTEGVDSTSPIRLLASARGPVLATLQADGSISIFKKSMTAMIFRRECVWSLQEPIDMAVKSTGNVAVLFRNKIILVLGNATKNSGVFDVLGGRKEVHHINLDPHLHFARLEYARRDMQLLLYPAHSPIHSHYTNSTDPPYNFRPDRPDQFMRNAFTFHDPLHPGRSSHTLKIGTPFTYSHQTVSRKRTCIFSFLSTAIDSTTGEFVIVRGEKIKLEISCEHSIDLDEGRATIMWMVVARIGGVTEAQLLASGRPATPFAISGASTSVVHMPSTGGFKCIAFGSGETLYVARVDVGDLLSHETSMEGERVATSTVRQLQWQDFNLGSPVRKLLWTSGYALTAFCDDAMRRLDFRGRIGTIW